MKRGDMMIKVEPRFELIVDLYSAYVRECRRLDKRFTDYPRPLFLLDKHSEVTTAIEDSHNAITFDLGYVGHGEMDYPLHFYNLKGLQRSLRSYEAALDNPRNRRGWATLRPYDYGYFEIDLRLICAMRDADAVREHFHRQPPPRGFVDDYDIRLLKERDRFGSDWLWPEAERRLAEIDKELVELQELQK
jgi:hypothetical protein